MERDLDMRHGRSRNHQLDNQVPEIFLNFNKDVRLKQVHNSSTLTLGQTNSEGTNINI